MKLIISIVLSLFMIMFSPLSLAASVDMTPITSQFVAADILAAILVIGGVLATLYAGMRAVNMGLKMIKG